MKYIETELLITLIAIITCITTCCEKSSNLDYVRNPIIVVVDKQIIESTLQKVALDVKIFYCFTVYQDVRKSYFVFLVLFC